MAATKYEVMCRYYNVDMKMPITNIVNETWVSCFEENTLMTNFSEETFEFCIQHDLEKEIKMQELLVYGNNYNNPKYNMFFVYKSREIMYNQIPSNKRKAILATPVYDKVPSATIANTVLVTLAKNEEVTLTSTAVVGGISYSYISTLDGTYKGYVRTSNLIEVTTDDANNYVLKDRMERIAVSPWFIHSTHASLESAMTKARQLANLVGHDNIKIGKIVPLDQFIEIV